MLLTLSLILSTTVMMLHCIQKCHLKTLSSPDDDQKVFGKTKPLYYLKQLSNSLKRREKQKTTYIDPTTNLRRLSD